MAAPGSYYNPASRSCWETCRACGRCTKKGTSACPVRSCSGRFDPNGQIDEHPDDYCTCTSGVLRWRTQKGQLVVTPYARDPFKGSVTFQPKTEDERDWDSYVKDMQEKYNDPKFNPIQTYEDK